MIGTKSLDTYEHSCSFKPGHFLNADWLDQWASSHSLSKHKAAVDKLTQLQIVKLSGPQRAPRCLQARLLSLLVTLLISLT